MVLPIMLLSQNQPSTLSSRNPLSIPYLFAEKNQHVNARMLSFYKVFSTFHNFENTSTSQRPVKQRLDSIISIPVDTFFSNRRSLYYYNAYGQQTSQSEYEWNKSINTWYNISKIDWVYDFNRNNVSYTTYYGDELNWFNELKFENTLDQNFRLIKTESFGWNESTSQWEIGAKVENTYNANGQLTTIIFYEWDAVNSLWKPASKYEYEYNTSGQIITAIEYEWQGLWTNKSKGEFTYYVFGKELSFIYYVWDGFSLWGNSFKSETQYNGNRKLTDLTEYTWDLISVIWVNSKKTEYKYDSENNMIQSIFSKWVKQLQSFILDSKEECIYTYQYLFDDLLLPADLKFSQTTTRIPDNDIYFNNMLSKYSHSLHNGVTYVSNNNRSFYYSPITITKINDPFNLDIQVEPNPADNYIRVVTDGWMNTMEFKLYDLNGKQRISKIINSNDAITLEDLPKGIYFYTISESRKLIAGRIIIN